MKRYQEFQDWCKAAPEGVLKALRRIERENARDSFANEYLDNSELKELALVCQEINQKTGVELINVADARVLIDIVLQSGAAGVYWLAEAPRPIRRWGVKYLKYRLNLIPDDPIWDEDILIYNILNLG